MYCVIYTFEQDQVKFYAWLNNDATEYPDLDMSQRLKDNMWGRYTKEHPNVWVNANQQMKISNDDGYKEIVKDGEQTYKFVRAHTNVHWDGHMEGTFFVKYDYSQNTEAWNDIRDGKSYWKGMQYLGFYRDSDEEKTDMLNK